MADRQKKRMAKAQRSLPKAKRGKAPAKKATEPKFGTPEWRAKYVKKKGGKKR